MRVIKNILLGLSVSVVPALFFWIFGRTVGVYVFGARDPEGAENILAALLGAEVLFLAAAVLTGLYFLGGWVRNRVGL